MVRLAHTAEKHKREAISTQHRFDESLHVREARFKLAYNLQASLDLRTTLESFFTNIQEFVNIGGMHYERTPSDIDLTFGKRAKHHATYNVSIDKSNLGKLNFSRDRRFSEAELAIVEMLIGVLFYPLRNALMYRDAVESSMRDALTEVGNRFALNTSFAREVKLALRHKRPLSLLVIDVDHFKAINDHHGHLCGDAALKQIASCIQNTLRETDQVFRYGGEEFVAVLNNTTAEGALTIGDRIRKNIADTTITLDNINFACTVSIGACTLSGRQTHEDLLKHADEALYIAKSKGRNRIVLWSGTVAEHAKP